jgi:polysaccharide chain length determinant protein (PEP-CTERM system associated)
MEDDVKTVNDYIGILKRRKWAFLLPVVIIFIIGLVAALAWPRTYRSTSTILIEEQELPREFVLTTVTGYADQRLQSINQRIMSTTRLLDIINQFNLYADLRKRMTTEEVVEIMRKDIKFETISSDVMNSKGTTRATASSVPVTIAFTLAYDGRNPQVVQQVANVLASLYLEENLKTRERQSAGASRFLVEEAQVVQRSLAGLDARIAVFKAKNINAVPELQQVNYQGLDRAERDLDQFKDQLKSMKEKEQYLQTQLASIPTESTDQDRSLLKDLKAKLVQLENRYSDDYPDVKKTRMDIAVLEKRIALLPPKGQASPKKGLTSVADQPNNPSYVALASQLSGVQSDIEAAKRQIAELEKRREDYVRRTEAAPRVEETYKTLMAERTNTETKYQDLMKRVMEAKVSQGLEKEQMGEKFTLIDPARLPEKPEKPNVPAVLLIGLFLGIGAGVGNVSLKEAGDQSARSAGQLAGATGYPVLAAIPRIITQVDRRRGRVRRRRILIAVGVAVAAVVLLFHFFVMDLDVAWARLSRLFMP